MVWTRDGFWGLKNGRSQFFSIFNLILIQQLSNIKFLRHCSLVQMYLFSAKFETLLYDASRTFSPDGIKNIVDMRRRLNCNSGLRSKNTLHDFYRTIKLINIKGVLIIWKFFIFSVSLHFSYWFFLFGCLDYL